MSAVVSRFLSAVLRKGGFVAMTLVACAAVGLASARAEVTLRAPGAAPSLQLALTQSEIAWCRNSAAHIRSMQSRYRSACSGGLTQQQYARCQQMGRELRDAIARHNASCR